MCGPRIMTLFVYLSDVEEGGLTSFVDLLDKSGYPLQAELSSYPNPCTTSIHKSHVSFVPGKYNLHPEPNLTQGPPKKRICHIVAQRT